MFRILQLDYGNVGQNLFVAALCGAVIEEEKCAVKAVIIERTNGCFWSIDFDECSPIPI